MTRILGIHGISKQYKGGHQLGSTWFDSLRDGLVAAGHRRKADTLVSGDLRVAFFGDLFRPRGSMASAEPPLLTADLTPGLERDLLEWLYDAAVAQQPSLGPPEGAMGWGRPTVQVMLDRLLRSRTLAGVARRRRFHSRFETGQPVSYRFVSEAGRACAGSDAEVDDGTRVVIGHSLGSVVAYEYLCLFQPGPVDLLVTLGSPLGIPNLVFDRLTPAPRSGLGVWPGGLAAWVNVADPDDIVALRKDLAPLFPGSSEGRAVWTAGSIMATSLMPLIVTSMLTRRPNGLAFR